MTALSMPLLNGWCTTALGELAVLINGDRGKNYPSKGEFTESGVPFINAGHLVDGRIKHERMNYISHSHFNRLSSGKTLPGDVVYCLRGSLGKAALVTESDVGAIASSLVILRPHSFACSRFLYYFVVGPFGKSQIEEFDNGSAQPNLSAKSLGQYTVPLPPLKEQKRIADKLDQTLAIVERAKARLARVPEILKQFRQSVLAAATDGRLTEDWRELNPAATPTSAKDEVIKRLEDRRRQLPPNKKFKEPVAPDMSNWDAEVPETWSVESVSSYAECLDHLRVPVTKEKRASNLGLYPYYGANGQVDLVDEFIFDDELVLVTEDETFYGREKPIAYRVSGRCWVNNHAHVLLAGDRYRAEYLCYALMFYPVLPWLTGTTGRAKLTQGVLNSLPIAVPPQLEIEEIVRRVETLFALADRIEARYQTISEKVDKLTQSLLAKAFRGELVPQDPNDEPASVLLDRIRAQRASAPAPAPKRGRRKKEGEPA